MFVKDLKPGDLVEQSDVKTLKVGTIEIQQRQKTVYNMTVEGFHTYFVSRLGIWVHSAEYEVSISKLAARAIRKLSHEDQKGYNSAIEKLQNGESTGLNLHALKAPRAGQWAADIKGTGPGRGDKRLIYTKDS